MEQHRIITYFESLEAETLPQSQREELEAIRTTLKLWESLYQDCATHAELQNTLNACVAKREKAILFVESLDESTHHFIQSHPGNFETILLWHEGNLQHQETEEVLRRTQHVATVPQVASSKRELITTVKKVSSRDLFGAEKYLSYGTPLHFFVLTRSEDRAWFVDRFIDYVGGLDGIIPTGSQELARMAGEVLDELLMNAIWDANPARATVSRSEPVLLRHEEAVKVEWGVDGHILAVGVRDPFGTFEKNLIKRYHDDIFGLKKGSLLTVKSGNAGAGIGLHMVLRRVAGLVVNRAPGFATEVIALFDLSRPPHLHSKGAKGLHFFSL
jgi:hypothetical protein